MVGAGWGGVCVCGGVEEKICVAGDSGRWVGDEMVVGIKLNGWRQVWLRVRVFDLCACLGVSGGV